MDCQESQSLMAAYIDGELDSSTAIRYAAHLDSCADCARACRDMQDMHAMIKTHATHHAAPSHLQHRIQSALPRTTSHGKPAKFSLGWINFGVAIASSLAFVVTFSLYMDAPSAEDRAEQEVIASHARSLMLNHLSDVISSDQHTVKPWFSDKLDYSPTVYDFAADGYALLGGRLDYLNQRPVAAMAYQHRKHLLNLFVWPDKNHAEDAQQATSRQGYQMIHWTQNGMRYWVISDMNAQDLGKFKNLLALQIEKDRQQ